MSIEKLTLIAVTILCLVLTIFVVGNWHLLRDFLKWESRWLRADIGTRSWQTTVIQPENDDGQPLSHCSLKPEPPHP